MRIKEAGKYGLGIKMWCTQSKLVLLSSERKGPLSWTPSTAVLKCGVHRVNLSCSAQKERGHSARPPALLY